MLELFLMMLCKPGLRPGFKGIDDNIVVTFHSHIYIFLHIFFYLVSYCHIHFFMINTGILFLPL